MNQDPISRYTDQLKSSWEPRRRHPSQFKNAILAKIEARQRKVRRNILTAIAIVGITVPFGALHLNAESESRSYSAGSLASSYDESYEWWEIDLGEPDLTEGLSQDYVILASLFLEEPESTGEETIP